MAIKKAEVHLYLSPRLPKLKFRWIMNNDANALFGWGEDLDRAGLTSIFLLQKMGSSGYLQPISGCSILWLRLTLLKKIIFLSARSRRAKSSSVKTTKWLKMLSF